MQLRVQVAFGVVWHNATITHTPRKQWVYLMIARYLRHTRFVNGRESPGVFHTQRYRRDDAAANASALRHVAKRDVLRYIKGVLHYFPKSYLIRMRIVSALAYPVVKPITIMQWLCGSSGKGKILIQTGYMMGDLLLLSPVLSCIKRAFPNSEIHLLTSHAGADFVKHSGWVDQCIPFTPFWVSKNITQSSLREFWHTLRTLRRERYDLSIDFHGDIYGAAMLMLSNIPVRVSSYDFGASPFCIDGIKTTKENEHELRRNNAILKAFRFDWQLSPTPPQAPIWPPQHPHGRRVDTADVVIHPGASAAARVWPAQSVVELVKSLRSKNVKVSIIGSRHDRAIINDIGVGAIYTDNYADLEKVIRSAKVVVCMDSFAQHAAWALGTPSVVLFSDKNPRYTANMDHRTVVVWNNQLLQPPFDAWSGPCGIQLNSSHTVLEAVMHQLTSAGNPKISPFGK